MTSHPVAPETPAGLDAMREAVAAVEAAMASCEADGHKCACRQFGWQFDAEAHQCSARLSGARSAIRAADGPLATVMRERDRLVALVSSSEAERYRSCSELLDRALAAEAELATVMRERNEARDAYLMACKQWGKEIEAAEAELATLKTAARDGEAARQEEFDTALTQAEARGRAAGLEEAAKLVGPTGARPCDCERWMCGCGNSGDTAQVVDWDAANDAARAIRALIPPQPPALDTLDQTEGGR